MSDTSAQTGPCTELSLSLMYAGAGRSTLRLPIRTRKMDRWDSFLWGSEGRGEWE